MPAQFLQQLAYRVATYPAQVVDGPTDAFLRHGPVAVPWHAGTRPQSAWRMADRDFVSHPT